MTNRSYYFFTPHEIACSRDIMQAVREDAVNALRLYPAAWVTWAHKVEQWAHRFAQVLRRYAKLMQGASLAVKAVWQNLKAGISIPKMLRLLETKPQHPRKWQHNRPTERGQVPAVNLINPKTARTEYRAHNTRTANALQCCQF